MSFLDDRIRTEIDLFTERMLPGEESNIPDDEKMELFCAECALKEFSPSLDELKDGVVDGGNDGKIDSIYATRGGDVISDFVEFASNPDLISESENVEIHIIQSKSKSGGRQEAIANQIAKTLQDMYALVSNKKTREEIDDLYNSKVTSRLTEVFDMLKALLRRRPNIEFKITICNKLGSSTPKKYAKHLDSVSRDLSQALGFSVKIKEMNGESLVERSQFRPSYSGTIVAREQLDINKQVVCLVTLEDWYKFIVEENGEIKGYLFDYNVRDFQGETVSVNSEIARTLADQSSDIDFWWLNNGITIVCDTAPSGNFGELQLRNMQIVNGLQTSYSIYNSFKNGNIADARKSQHLLVKVITSSDDNVRDAVITATNSQTPVDPYVLRGSRKEQRDIERLLLSNGIYYERRKKYYSNQGKPQDSIVSVAALTQSYMSIFLQQPYLARSKPSSLVKKDEDYMKVFPGSEGFKLNLYNYAARSYLRVNSALNAGNGFRGNIKNNIRFYVSAIIARGEASGSLDTVFNASRYYQLTSFSAPDDLIVDVGRKISDILMDYADNSNVSVDTAAKRREFWDNLRDDFDHNSAAWLS